MSNESGFNRRSKNITQGVSRSPNRSMYYAMGYEKADLDHLIIVAKKRTNLHFFGIM